eukprot:SAG31_NODE_45383_length_259_cov_0.643750_2_plen_21_part_01
MTILDVLNDHSSMTILVEGLA